MNDSRRWRYLMAATVSLLFLGLIYAWSLFRIPFGEMFPSWTISQLSLTFTISMVSFCLGGYVGGLLSGRLSIRIRLLYVAALLFIGFLGVSFLNTNDPSGSLLRLYLFYGVCCGFGVGIGYTGIITTVTKWFPDRVGTASGVMLMGFGLGGLILGSAVNVLIGSVGLFLSFRILAAAAAIVLAIGAMVIRAPEQDRQAGEAASADSDGPDGPDGSNGEVRSAAQESYTSSQMLRTARYWLFLLWAILLNAAGLMVINSAASIAVSFGGAAVLGMIVSLFNGFGRLLAGNNFDRFGRKLATMVNIFFMLLAAILMILGSRTGSLLCIALGLICVGMAYGGVPTMVSAYINKAFGAEYFTMNYSVTNPFSMLPAAILGPMISARLLESAGGEYGSNFLAVGVFSLAALAVWFLLNLASRESHN